MKTKKIRFETILGSKIDGRGGQLFYLSKRTGIISSRFDFYSFYVRADDGLRDCWAEFDLDTKQYSTLLGEILATAPLPIFTVSFEYVKKRVQEGIAYKEAHNKNLPEEFESCKSILDSEAKNDLSWKTPSFFSNTLKDYDLRHAKNKLLNEIDTLVLNLFSEMLSLGWGFNDEEMNPEMPTLSKLKYNPIEIWHKTKLLDIFPDPKLEKVSHSFYRLLNSLMFKIIDENKVKEWEIRSREHAYFCYNIGEEETAKKLHKISLTLGMIPKKIGMQEHPFLQALMLISIMATLKRHHFLV